MKKVRGKSPIYMAIVLMLAISAIIPVITNMGYAIISPTVSVEPSNPVANPTEYFTVNITVQNAPEIEAWQVKLSWDPAILKFPSGKAEAGEMIKEGPFLNDTGPTAFLVAEPNLVERYVLFGCHLKTNVTSPPSGSGVLANVTFYVKESGVTDIKLLEAKLVYHEGGDVPGVTTTDAYFYTTKPYVDFTWTPVSPEINETTTFNASACWDPDGGSITQYSWNFGDGNITATSDPVITHKYSGYNETGWLVNLTVTDDDAETWSKTKTLRMWHEVTADDIWPTLDYIDSVHWEATWAASGMWTELWFLLTATNLGSYTETFNITLYADLNATVIGDEHVIHWRYPYWGWWLEDSPYCELTLGPGTGSGWWPFFAADLVGWEEGNYTITMEVSVVPGEVNTANNVYTAPKLLSVTAIPSWLSGDANMDGVVDIFDIVLGASVFGGKPGDWLAGYWDPRADMNQDGLIDIFDLVLMAVNFGQTF